MEASALPLPAPRGQIFVSASLLRLRSDDQLVALFRSGSDEAFHAIHDRYQQRLFAYVRQMLAGSRPDAEDALQDVFVRAHAALRASSRPVSLRAWLYRIAHNRCIDQLRRPTAIPTDMATTSFASLHDPVVEAERREDLRRLVGDVHELPAQQRSALLMRELQGMSYADLAVALDVSVPAIKSLLLRARTSLIEAAIARDTSCDTIQADLVDAHDLGIRASARARRHIRECDHCSEYRLRLRSLDKSFAALAPAAPLGLGFLAKLFGGSGAAAGGAGATGSLAGGGAALGGAATVTAGKVAALVCCAALVGAGVAQRTSLPTPSASHSHHARAAARSAQAPDAPAALARNAPALQPHTGGTLLDGPAPRHTGADWSAQQRRARTGYFLTGQDTYPNVVIPPGTGAPAGSATGPQRPGDVAGSAPSDQAPLASLLPGPGGSTQPGPTTAGTQTGPNASAPSGSSSSGSSAGTGSSPGGSGATTSSSTSSATPAGSGTTSSSSSTPSSSSAPFGAGAH